MLRSARVARGHGMRRSFLCARPPAGREAERIATLFWWMTGGALAVWLVVSAITLYATYFSPGGASAKSVRRLVLGGGLVVPGVLLTVLLIFGLAAIPPLLASPPDGSLTIAVTGEQWWWRVHQLLALDGDRAHSREDGEARRLR